jgi:hypothetical protein
VTYARTERAVVSSPVDVYGLHLQVEGVSHAMQGGQTRTHETGPLMLIDCNVPFHAFKPGWARHRVIRIPRRQLDALMAPGWAAC